MSSPQGSRILEPGTVLAQRYTIIKPIGRGGMGAVYLASMQALGGKKVAVKEMELYGHKPSELEAALKQFQTEATFLANLDHANLVSVSDFFTEGNRYYLVMAYVDGETLDQKMRRQGQAFGWTQVREWALTLCDVLHYLHSCTPPILFRDLKPSNIMVDGNGTLKLIDFGIARLGEDGSKTSTFLQGTGTSGFSPIEQYGGSGSTDVRSDVYSLGATIYLLLTGQVPPDAVSRLSGKSIQPPSLLRPELNHAVDAVILRAMAQLAKDRYTSMEEMRRALDQVPATSAVAAPPTFPAVLPGALEPPGPDPLPPRSEPSKIRFETFPTQLQPKARASTWAIAVASLLTACLAVGAISSLRPPSETGGQASKAKTATLTQPESNSSVKTVAASEPAIPSGFPVSSDAPRTSSHLKTSKPSAATVIRSIPVAPQPVTRQVVSQKPAAKLSEDDYPKARRRVVQVQERIEDRRHRHSVPPASEQTPRPRVATLPPPRLPAEAYPPAPPAGQFPQGPPGAPTDGQQYGGQPGFPPPGPPPGGPPGMSSEEGIPGLKTTSRRHRR